jgi:dihydrofolate synthase/folylpolyglutamate synthase
MTFAHALAVLEARQEVRIELGLGRLRRHLKSLGDPQERLRCFHVAGTNGKGSVCAVLESVLRSAGYKTGLYTSPHLVNVRERIRLAGRDVSRADFARFMGRTLKADPRGRLTYFELLTSVAFQAFAQAGVDVVVLETGLGGRLDATNVIKNPVAALITSIELDHTAFLGASLGRIAAEKAGIFKPGCPAFSPSLPPAALRSISGRARAVDAPLVVVAKAWQARNHDWQGNSQILISGRRRCKLGLLGARQGRNVALVEAALRSTKAEFPVSPEAWRRGLESVRLAGRFEVLRVGKKTAILDGAHNPEAVAQLVGTLRVSPWRAGDFLWILGVVKDKDWRGIVRKIAPLLREVVVVRPPSPRALDALILAGEIRRQAPRARVNVESDPDTALRRWLSRGGGPRAAVVAGSFYLVGRARRLLKRAGGRS